MFEQIPLPLAWPVYVSQAEAAAFARWRGCRLPTEAEFQRAAYGTREEQSRRYPWGEMSPGPRHGVFDFTSWDPAPAGSHPDGASAWGVEDLVGNGWEWTSTVFAPFPGFAPMPSYPEYSADFFDGKHYVMKGASPATARELLRPSLRNWFRPRYPYVYATFRCVDARPS
jgi:gamma-glutamyl hercynylcysteine S-oxide synthase